MFKWEDIIRKYVKMHQILEYEKEEDQISDIRYQISDIRI